MQGMISFIAIFLKVWQQQNVINNKIFNAAITSYLIAGTEIATVSMIVKGGWETFIPIGTGGALGVVLSLITHKRIMRCYN